MKGCELEDVFRETFRDLEKDYFVTKTMFYIHLNEAQDEACIRSDLLEDSGSIPIIADKSTYPLGREIRTINHAHLVDSGGTTYPLILATKKYLDWKVPDWRDANPGLPKYLIIYTNSVQLSPTPLDAYTMPIEYYRLPINRVTENNEPEIHRANHLSLLDWVLHKVYNTRTIEIYDQSKSLEYEQRFIAKFGERKFAEEMMNQFSDEPHVNLVYL